MEHHGIYSPRPEAHRESSRTESQTTDHPLSGEKDICAVNYYMFSDYMVLNIDRESQEGIKIVKIIKIKISIIMALG